MPDLVDRLDAVPTRGHPHIDESHGVRPRPLAGRNYASQSLLPMENAVHLKLRQLNPGRPLAQHLRLHLGQLRGEAVVGHQDRPEGVVNPRVVVNHKNAVGLFHFQLELQHQNTALFKANHRSSVPR